MIQHFCQKQFYRTFHTCDVSVAVDTGSGLITPIVTGVEAKGLAEISESVKEMAGRWNNLYKMATS